MAVLNMAVDSFDGEDSTRARVEISSWDYGKHSPPYLKFDLPGIGAFKINGKEDIAMLAMYCTHVLSRHDQGAL